MLYFTLRICIKCLYWKQRVVQSIAIISRVLARVVKRAPSDMYSLGFWSIVKSRWYKNVAKISNGFRFTFSPCILRSVIYNWRLRKKILMIYALKFSIPARNPTILSISSTNLWRISCCFKGFGNFFAPKYWIKSNEILKLTLYVLIVFISPIPMVSLI